MERSYVIYLSWQAEWWIRIAEHGRPGNRTRWSSPKWVHVRDSTHGKWRTTKMVSVVYIPDIFDPYYVLSTPRYLVTIRTMLLKFEFWREGCTFSLRFAIFLQASDIYTTPISWNRQVGKTQGSNIREVFRNGGAYHQSANPSSPGRTNNVEECSYSYLFHSSSSENTSLELYGIPSSPGSSLRELPTKSSRLWSLHTS